MPKNTQEIKTLAYVLKRTNYLEADRILSLITPSGKMSAIAKGARRAKSKLAGGVEMFSLTELIIHQGNGKMGLVTSARMIKFYDKIMTDFNKMEVAAQILKKINTVAESSDAPEYFDMVDECLCALNDGENVDLVQSWFLLNVLRVSGEEVNVYRDAMGEKLSADKKYEFDVFENAFLPRKSGRYGADEIKMIRLMLTAKLNMVAKVKGVEALLPAVTKFARNVNKMI